MIKPVNKYILIEPIATSKKGEIHIIEKALPFKKGIVKAVAGSITQCKAGDTVAYLKRIVADLKIDKVDLEFIDESSLLYVEE